MRIRGVDRASFVGSGAGLWLAVTATNVCHDGGGGAHPTAAENHNGKELELRGEALQVVHISFGRSLVARLFVSDQRISCWLLSVFWVHRRYFKPKPANGCPPHPSRSLIRTMFLIHQSVLLTNNIPRAFNGKK